MAMVGWRPGYMAVAALLCWAATAGQSAADTSISETLQFKLTKHRHSQGGRQPLLAFIGVQVG